MQYEKQNARHNLHYANVKLQSHTIMIKRIRKLRRLKATKIKVKKQSTTHAEGAMRFSKTMNDQFHFCYSMSIYFVVFRSTLLEHPNCVVAYATRRRARDKSEMEIKLFTIWIFCLAAVFLWRAYALNYHH